MLRWDLVFYWLLTIYSSLCFADVRFGTEFTLTNEAIRKEGGFNVHLLDAQQDFLRWIRSQCVQAGCEISEKRGNQGFLNYRVRFQDGWYFDLSMDPSVIEITTKPGTRKEWKSIEEKVEHFIFEGGRAIGVTPAYDTGGGHIHLDSRSTFNENSLLLRNFMVDFYNHPEFGLNYLRHHTSANSRHLAELSETTQEAFFEVIRAYDQDYKQGDQWSIEKLAEEIHEKVHLPAENRGEISKARYMALNLERLLPGYKGSRTLEVRSVRPHQDTEDFFLSLELIEKRLEYLSRKNKALAVRKYPPLPFSEPLEKQVQAFKKFLLTMGIDNPQDYRKALPYYIRDDCGSLFFRVR